MVMTNLTAQRMNQTWSNIMKPLSGRSSTSFVRPLTTEEKQRFGYSTQTSQMSDYIKTLQQQQEAANAANEARYAEAKSLYSQALGRYGEGGTFGAGFEAQLARQKTQAMASGEQALAQRGLYNTTIAAGLGKKFEEEVGAPARLKLEDIRQERLTEAERAVARVVERREDTGVDANLIAQLIAQASAR